MQYPQYFTKDCFKKEDAAVIQSKVEALIAVMTDREKAQLCHGGVNPEIPGQVANGGYIAGVPRLGVPEIRMFDGPAGVTSIYETTGLPAEEMLACTWDKALAKSYGKVTGSENVMISGNCQLGAEVDLVRTTHFNRTRDMLGEDPCLASELATEIVQGIQEEGAMATLKHFAGYVVSANPANSPDTQIDEQTLHELYLKPFEKCIHEGNAAAVMTAYNRINGPYAANSAPLLKEVLRHQWGFDGFTMCDWGGNHSFSLKNGMDIEMPLGAYNSTERILKFLEDGRLSREELDLAARHILTGMGKLGYLSLVTLDGDGRVCQEKGRTEPIRMPDTYKESQKRLEENAKIAREVAIRGAVLLKNEGQALPIREEALAGEDFVALVGPGSIRPVCGYGQERSYGTLKYMDSPVEALKAASHCPEKYRAFAGIDLWGSPIPAQALSLDAGGTKKGLARYYGISEADGYRPPLGVGGEGLEFTGTAARDADADEEEGTLDFKPMDLFMPSNDAVDMDGFETGSLWGIDPVIDFRCPVPKPDNESSVTAYKNSGQGNAFVKGEAYTWKGYVLAEETGEYQINLEGIGGTLVFKMDVDGTGYRDMGMIKMREGSQWPWGNLICTPSGMEIASTRVFLEGGRRYPVILYAKALMDTKDLQVRLSWVTPSDRLRQRREALEAAKKAAMTIFFVHSGYKTAYEKAEGGLSFAEGVSLELEEEQKELLLETAGVCRSHGHKLVVAAYHGSAFAMGGWIDEADALLYMWMPGQSGANALAQLLLGQRNPSGKLSQSFPAFDEDTLITDTKEHETERWFGRKIPGMPDQILASEGIFTGYRWYDKTGIKPLFPFGFGLSYTSFEYSGLRVQKQEQGLLVSLCVKNTGAVAGDEIVQVYVAGGQVPVHIMLAKKQLCGFARLDGLMPGEKRAAKIFIPYDRFLYWDPLAPLRQSPDGTWGRWQRVAGTRTLLAGPSSHELPLRTNIDMF